MSLSKKGISIILLTILVSVLSFSFVFAADENVIAPLKDELGAPIEDAGGIVNIFVTAAKWMYTIVLIFAIIMILASAYNFITGGGNDAKIKKAKEQLKFAIVGIIVAAFAAVAVLVVNNFIGGNGGGGTPPSEEAPPPGGITV